MSATLQRFGHCSATLLWSTLALGAFADDRQFVLDKGATDGDVIVRAATRRNVRAIRIHGCRLSDASFVTFAQWPDLYGVYADNTTITGVGFAKLERHEHLIQVNLFGPNVNDDGLRAVSRLPHVTHLGFGNGWDNKDFKCRFHHPIITDRGLAAVATMPKLAYLEIDNADITDDGIQQLASLRSAQLVRFFRCKRLTRNGLERLKAALPQASVSSVDPDFFAEDTGAREIASDPIAALGKKLNASNGIGKNGIGTPSRTIDVWAD